MQGGGAGPQPELPRSPPPHLGPGAAPEGLAWVPQETGLRGWWLHGGWRDRLMPAALQEDALGARLGLPGTRISSQSPSQFRCTLDSGTGLPGRSIHSVGVPCPQYSLSTKRSSPDDGNDVSPYSLSPVSNKR